jgi:hypothetical protein
MKSRQGGPSDVADAVLEVFLVPRDFDRNAKALNDLAAGLENDLQLIAKSFSANLRGVIQTLSIPYQYTQSHVQILHWQRIHIAEMIRARSIENESERKPEALRRAKDRMESYVREEGLAKIVDDILDRLLSLTKDAESLAAARELMRQGVVLTWSALEVLARDLFILLLNTKPALSTELLATPSNRKRFSPERIDWSVLASHDFDLSSRLGTYFISKADLTSMTSIRDIYAALLPNALDLQRALADQGLWMLQQKRNLIVHKRGVVDQQYLSSTGDLRALGSTLTVLPKELEELHDAVLIAGTELTRQVSSSL